MKKQDGIALIATLLIMVAIMALGVGTMFLSTMNLKIAENSRTQAVAHYNAEAGMEAAIVRLKKDYEAATPKQFPAAGAFVLPTSPDASTVTYQSVSYTPYTTAGSRTQARVVIVGTGPNNARYQTEALFASTSNVNTDPNTPPDPNSFPRGLVSEGRVTAKGDHELINARIHGNRGFDLNGNGKGYTQCTGANLDVCTELSGTSIPISAGRKEIGDTYNYYCDAKGDLCDSETRVKSAYLKDKVNIGAPPYVARRNLIFKTTSLLPATESSPQSCTRTVTALPTTYTAGETICVSGNVNITNDRIYSNVNIIIKGTLTIAANVNLYNTNILSTGAMMIEGNATMNTSRLFSDTDVVVNGNVPYTGSSTIAAGRDMTLKGNIEHTDTSSTDIGMGLMSGRNFRAEGNMKGAGSKSQRLVNVAVWAGGTADVSGASAIRGGISSVGNLSVNGASDIDGRGNFTNTDLATAGSGSGTVPIQQMVTSSRR